MEKRETAEEVETGMADVSPSNMTRRNAEIESSSGEDSSDEEAVSQLQIRLKQRSKRRLSDELIEVKRMSVVRKASDADKSPTANGQRRFTVIKLIGLKAAAGEDRKNSENPAS